MLTNLSITDNNRDKAVKICGVCGDRAKSYHFGGISCDSCKAFFRRSVQNDARKTFQCSFEGSCEVTMANRKCCQYCRFRKCVEIGMEATWVMNEEQRLMMLQERLWKRAKRKLSASSSSADRNGAADAENCIKYGAAAASGECFHPTRRNIHSPPFVVTPTDELDIADCPRNRPNDDQLEMPPDVLNLEEKCQIGNAMSAFEFHLKSKTTRRLLKEINCNSSKWLLIVSFIINIQKLVRFARNIEPFSNLELKDQIVLLRANIFEMFLVVHFSDVSFDCGSDQQQLPPLDAAAAHVPTTTTTTRGKCPFLASGLALSDHRAILTDTESFRVALRSVLKDSATLVLFLLVVLFSADDSSELLRADAIEFYQIYFCNLVRKHLKCVCGGDASALPKLLILLPSLREIREKHVAMHLDLCDVDVDLNTCFQ